MKDLHSHYLPTVDDGSRNINVTKDMLFLANAYGVKDIVFTPHYIEDSIYNSTKSNNEKIFNEVKNVAKEFGINIYLANEVYLTSNIVKLLKSNIISSINNSRYVLIEIPMYSKVNQVKDIFFDVISNGYVPILAHPERYTAYYKDIKFFYELRKMGVLMQINYPSLVGIYGSHAKKMAKLLLKNNLISFVGSDVHRPDEKRMKAISKAEKIVYKILGEVEGKKVLEGNFESVINNIEIK